ncbi:MAG: aspartate carbamoyltransferase regulatory subunit, partial [Bacteroidales bacterium]|nr:aspartate carbamoyltransferase regulatory subunit [Bacteroidales bacterium]
ILGIENMENGVFIGNNLSSRSMGHKGLIKIADIDLPKETLNRIAVVAPNAVINIIKDYEVVEKHKVELPEDLFDIVKCTNPKCISNNEPMSTHFHVLDKDEFKCHFCERIVSREEVVLK